MTDTLGNWAWLVGGEAALLFAVVCAMTYMARPYHLGDDLPMRAMVGILINATAFYIIAALVVSQLIFSIPISSVIENGFGSKRVAWVLLFLALEIALRLHELIRRGG